MLDCCRQPPAEQRAAPIKLDKVIGVPCTLKAEAFLRFNVSAHYHSGGRFSRVRQAVAAPAPHSLRLPLKEKDGMGQPRPIPLHVAALRSLW